MIYLLFHREKYDMFWICHKLDMTKQKCLTKTRKISNNTHTGRILDMSPEMTNLHKLLLSILKNKYQYLIEKFMTA